MSSALNFTYPRRLAATIARIGLGLLFVWHAWTKVTTGPTKMIQFFNDSHVPFSSFSFWFAFSCELVCGIFLIVGFVVPIASLFLIIDMLAALITVHLPSPTDTDGWELPCVYLIALIIVAVTDYGSLGLDGTIRHRLKKSSPALKAEAHRPQTP